MASILDLVHETSSDLKDRARSADGVKVSQKKNELIKELADEKATEAVDNILEMDLSELRERAGDSQGRKAELQEALLQEEFQSGGSGGSAGGSSGGFWPARESDGVPRADLDSHFDDFYARQDAIREAAERATAQALDEQMAFVVLESLRPSDQSEPIKIRRAYEKRHPDEILVFEARVPMSPYPVKNADKDPVTRL